MATSWRGVLSTESARVMALGQERCLYVEVKKSHVYIWIFHLSRALIDLFPETWCVSEVAVLSVSCSRTLCQQHVYLAIWSRVRFPDELVAGLAALIKKDNTISRWVSSFIRLAWSGPYRWSYEFITSWHHICSPPLYCTHRVYSHRLIVLPECVYSIMDVFPYIKKT